MNKKLLDFTRELSLLDKKNLVEKTLKTVEEVGELAKAVLPYSEAYATNHRFIPKEKILEESIDTILCALSVAYHLNFTEDEIDDMMAKKLRKWETLQKGEVDLQYPIPYEIHITVRNSSNEDIFKRFCKDIGAKPIILDLQNDTGTMRDVMTSSKFFGNNRTVYDEVQRQVAILKTYALFLELVRVKIETVPWHPAAPKKKGDRMPQSCYFEMHIPVTFNLKRKDELRSIIDPYGIFHLSVNTGKRNEDDTFTLMLTYRSYEYGAFEIGTRLIADHIIPYLKDNDFIIGKWHTEFAIYDTDVSHDYAWMNN